MLKVSEGYRDIQVEVLSFTQDLGPQAVRMAGLTWHQPTPAQGAVAVLAQKIREGKTSPKILEVGKVTFLIRNISRICLARLTRDACEAINAESQATPTFDDNMQLKSKHVSRRATVPLNIVNDPELYAEYKGILDMIEAFQLKLEGRDFCWAPDIRYIGTMGTQIDIAMEFNTRQFIAACNRRFISSINDEDNYAYRKMWAALKAAIQDTPVDDLTRTLWDKVIADCDPKVDFVDELLGTSYDRGHPFRGDGSNPIYTKEQTAWYYELKRIALEEPELLLDGEQEMIEKWL
jgi:hypothetical protein